MLTRGLQATVETTGRRDRLHGLDERVCASVELTPLRRSRQPAEQRAARAHFAIVENADVRVFAQASELRRSQANGDRMDNVEVSLGLGAHAADLRAGRVERRALHDIGGFRFRLRRRDGGRGQCGASNRQEPRRP